MVRASMATRNKTEVTTNNTNVQSSHEVNMGKFPGLHRKAILAIAAILLVVYFLPTSEDNNSTPQTPSLTQDLPVPIAPSVSDLNDQTTLPTAPDSLNEDQGLANINVPSTSDNNTANDVTTPPTQPSEEPTTAEPWKTYTIREGQTLAQLFRDNQLPVNDAFAMAKSEDQQKSLSQLRAGQTIRLQRNPQGDISMLEVTNSAGTVITFTRLSDGSYYRTP